MPQIANTALKRYGHAEDIAAMVAFVAGPDATYITGASLTVDGGTKRREGSAMDHPARRRAVAHWASPSLTPDGEDPMNLYHASGSPNSRRVRFSSSEGWGSIWCPSTWAQRTVLREPNAHQSRVVVPTLVLDDGTAIGEVTRNHAIFSTRPIRKLPLPRQHAEGKKPFVAMW